MRAMQLDQSNANVRILLPSMNSTIDRHKGSIILNPLQMKILCDESKEPYIPIEIKIIKKYENHNIKANKRYSCSQSKWE